MGAADEDLTNGASPAEYSFVGNSTVPVTGPTWENLGGCVETATCDGTKSSMWPTRYLLPLTT